MLRWSVAILNHIYFLMWSIFFGKAEQNQIDLKKHYGDDVPVGEDSYEEHLWYKVNTKYETSKLELSWINLGMRSHSHYDFSCLNQTAGIKQKYASNNKTSHYQFYNKKRQFLEERVVQGRESLTLSFQTKFSESSPSSKLGHRPLTEGPQAC